MDYVGKPPDLRRPFVRHPCYIEAKTVSYKLAWHDHRFCFDQARRAIWHVRSGTPPVLSAFMVQRRVGRLTTRFSEPDQHKVLTHGTCGGSLSLDR